VEANALAATVGTVVAVFGGMCAITLRGVAGTGNTASAWVTAWAVLGSLLAAAVTAGFSGGRLGPDPNNQGTPADQPTLARGLRDGVTAAARVPSVAAGLVALVAHRLSFGIATMVTLLLYRNSFTSDGLLRAGLAGVCQVLVAGAAGMLLAAVLTGPLVARFGRRHTVRGALLAAAVVIVILGLPMIKITILAAAFALATAGQVVKLSLDATVQSDVGDDARGRVFTLYDTVFNVGYVLAVALAATVVPLNGHAPHLLLLAAVAYLIAALVYGLIDRPPAHSAGSAGLSRS
ncbi:MAG TPA: MFS transporter, partial [Pseudonocardiaceae bacterium]